MSKQKVLLGMSGGTDSSVAAMLLKEQGYEVIGLTYRLWSDSDNSKNEIEPNYIKEAKSLSEKLQIEHYVLDIRDFFYSNIINYFKEEYMAGRTPNPCAKCNVILKWHLLLNHAKKLDCEFIATGHYAQIGRFNDRYYVHFGEDPDKEQSFFLWGLDQEILSRAILPLGKLKKEQVKAYATSKGFEKVAKKKESIGVCFIKDGNYQPFLKELLEAENRLPGEGSFIDESGKEIGKHNGFPFYTVGQRRGLGLIPKEPLYVTKINPLNNTIVLGKRNNLYQTQMVVYNYYFHSPDDIVGEVMVRIRYRKQKAMGKIKLIDKKRLIVEFTEPEWSIAPGQTAAFYINNRLIGGGYIEG